MQDMELTRLASPHRSSTAMNCLTSNHQIVGNNNHESMCKLLMQNGLASSPPSLELVTIALFFALAFCSLNTHLLVVLFQSREVFAGLRELALFHSFTDIPMHKRTFGVHEVELMVDAREDLGNGSAVADHAASAHHLGQITSWDHSGRLVVDATFESSRAPVNKLNR